MGMNMCDMGRCDDDCNAIQERTCDRELSQNEMPHHRHAMPGEVRGAEP